MTDMDVAIGIGRAVMQHEFFAPRRVLAQEAVEVHLLPAGDDLGLLLRETGAHGKLGLRQVEGLGIVDLFGRIGHFIAVRWAKRRRLRHSYYGKSENARLTRGKPGPSAALRPHGRPGQ